MKKLRIAILIIFLAVASFFAASYIFDKVTSDRVAPVISADSDTLEVSINATDEDLLSGMSAYDNVDGDVTDMLVVVSKSKFIRKGTVRVDYAAFDQSKNVKTYSREVTYTDYVSPYFRLSEPLRFSANSSKHDFLANIKAYDCLDGDLSKKIKISYGDTVPVSDTVSVQTIDIIVTNSFGDSASLQLTASLEDFTSYNRLCPALQDYLIYTKVGVMPDFRGNIIGVWANGETTRFDSDNTTGFTAADISVFNILNDPNGAAYDPHGDPLNIDKPGIYSVKYLLKTNDGQELGTTTLIVIVGE